MCLFLAGGVTAESTFSPHTTSSDVHPASARGILLNGRNSALCQPVLLGVPRKPTRLLRTDLAREQVRLLDSELVVASGSAAAHLTLPGLSPSRRVEGRAFPPEGQKSKFRQSFGVCLARVTWHSTFIDPLPGIRQYSPCVSLSPDLIPSHRPLVLQGFRAHCQGEKVEYGEVGGPALSHTGHQRRRDTQTYASRTQSPHT